MLLLELAQTVQAEHRVPVINSSAPDDAAIDALPLPHTLNHRIHQSFYDAWAEEEEPAQRGNREAEREDNEKEDRVCLRASKGP